MADISITAANVLASSGATPLAGIAGTVLTQGQASYYDATTGTWKTITALAAAALSTLATLQFGIALQSVSIGQPVLIAIKDPSFTYGANVASGSRVYVSAANAGGLTITSGDITTGDAVILMGVVTGATGATSTTMNLNPTIGGII
jgi:hypothetical protein